ncbi:MAG TPA: hypothetical protein VK968_09635 [Roseimicrobium sp.]|nr:hypothetical protein [Roseimicrobium sp.]
MKLLRLLSLLSVLAGPLWAVDVSPAAQARIDAKIVEIKAWAASPAIVDAVVAHNAAAPADHLAMTQPKWKSLSEDDAFVLGFTTNPAGLWLKLKQTAWVSEAFVSDAQGLKVAFLAKPTHWSHAGYPKHDQPMQGKVWQGAVELDESTGVEQVQIAVPVLAPDKKPIGSLVVGIRVEKLK